MSAALDAEFLARALQVTSFNLSASDLTSLKYKKEIQHLFNIHFFPGFDINKTVDSVDVTKLNGLISELKSINSSKFRNLHSYNLKGIGPGEVTLYFLINNAYLGGGSKKGDVIINGSEYEVKAVNVSNGVATGFFLGRTVGVDAAKVKIAELAKKLKLGGTPSEINKTIINNIKAKAPEEFKEIEEEYAAVAVKEYFNNKQVVFINNGASNLGRIEAVKYVSANDIEIDVVTNGTIKPKISLR